MSDSNLLLVGFGVLVSLIGLLGTVLPLLPGLPLLACGLVLLAWVGDFQVVGGLALTVIIVLAVLGMLADFVASLIGAKTVGASRQALWGACWGSVFGLVFGMVGLFVGPLLGAFLGELMARRALWQAGKVGFATVLGVVFGSLAKVVAALAMVGVFAIAYVG